MRDARLTTIVHWTSRAIEELVVTLAHFVLHAVKMPFAELSSTDLDANARNVSLESLKFSASWIHSAQALP